VSTASIQSAKETRMTSESGIKNEVRKELVRFPIAITKEDPIGAIVRSHLYVESLLLQIIEQGLSDPEQLSSHE
jgi:hypothetical protein